MKLKITVFIFVFLMITFVAIFRGLQESTDLRSKAANSEPIAIPTVVKAPKTVLTAPYIRLVGTTNTHTIGEKVTVDIYIRTNDQAVIATGIALKYDPRVLSFVSDDIISSPQFFPVINIEEVNSESARFSFFLSPEDGYEPITLTKEEKVGTMSFTVIGNPVKETVIELLPETGIFTQRDGQTGVSKNIMVSSEGETISLQ